MFPIEPIFRNTMKEENLEENLAENHTTPIVSEIYTKLSINEENSNLFMNSIFRQAKTEVEISSLRNLKVMPQKPQQNCTFMNSISGFVRLYIGLESLKEFFW